MGTVLESHANSTRLTNWSNCSRDMRSTRAQSPHEYDLITAELSDVVSVASETLEKQFNELAQRWRARKAGISSIEEMILIPEYQQILPMGRQVVPLILKDLERKPDHWFWALEILTKENPVRQDERGNLRQMAAAWINWGKRKGFI